MVLIPPSKEHPVAILGAGPAGMAAAMELWKRQIPLLLVEQNANVGGLARTLVFDEGNETFRTDIGPHRFFSKNPYLYTFIENLLGEEWKTVNRLTRFYIKGKLYLYPIELKNTLQNLGIEGSLTILQDYMWEAAKRVIRRTEPQNFEEFAVQTFGRSLAELNMLNYTRKIWGLPCTELSVDWANQRIKGLSLFSALRGAITPSRSDGPKTLVDQFYYPAQGTGQIYETIFQHIRADSHVLLSSQPIALTHEGQHVIRIDIRTNTGNIESVTPSAVVSSIPITQLLTLLTPTAPPALLEHTKELQYRSQIYLFVTLNKPHIIPDQWVYFPETHIPFGRVSEMKNFSDAMAPTNATSLFIEYFCWEGDETWNKTKERLLEQSLPWFEQWGWFHRADIRQVYHHRQANVYPVYDLTYEEHLEPLKKYVDSFTNLFAIGRPGRFKYNNQDHSLEMGILAARSIIEQKRFSFDDVANEKEYFESGALPVEKISSAHSV